MIAQILTRFFQDQLGVAYSVGAFRNAVQTNAPSTEVMRVLQSTDEIITKMLAQKKIRAILRTSQSDYIGLIDADGASFTWTLEFAAPIGSSVDDDIERIRNTFTEKVIPVQYQSETDIYELLLTFTIPAKFAAVTINGTDYQQVVWGGRGTIVKNSVVANGYSFSIDGVRIPGVLSLNNGFTAIGESFNTERSAQQRTALQTFTNAVGLSIHATKNNAIISRMIHASVMGDTNGFEFEIKQNDVSVATWETAVFNQVSVSASIGSYVLINAQVLRS